MAKRDKPSIKDYRALSRLAVYIIIGGWILLIFYALVIYEYAGDTLVFSKLVKHFLSPDQFGIRFRALIFFAPFIATMIGYLVYERARMLKRTIQLMDKFEHLSKTDDLTKLMNRRALIESLESETDRVKRYGSSFSLILCDIDFLKMVNDSSGHEYGDRVLRIVAQKLKTHTRKSDIIGRYSGDEFMVIMPETGIENAKTLAERICSLIWDYEFKLASGIPFKLSLSVGITNFFSKSDDMEEMLKRADNALYASKQKGRNKVTIIEYQESPDEAKETPDNQD